MKMFNKNILIMEFKIIKIIYLNKSQSIFSNLIKKMILMFLIKIKFLKKIRFHYKKNKISKINKQIKMLIINHKISLIIIYKLLILVRKLIS